MHDTTRDAEELRLEVIRRMDPSERMRQALEFSELMRQLALTRLRSRYPGLPDIQLVEILLGEKLIPTSNTR